MKNTVIITVAAVLAVAVAAWGGYAFCTQINIKDAELYALIPLYIVLLFLGAAVSEMIHEGAHFLVGACCSMGVKPPKLRIFKSSSVEIYPNGKKAMKLRFILTAGAGLFFDMLLIVLGIISIVSPSVPVLFCIPLPYALYQFIVNAAPVEYKSGKTDGLALWEVITGKPTAQVMLTVLRVQGMVRSGTRLREIDESMLLDVPQLPEDDINFIILTQLRYEYYLDVGNDSEAYKYFLRYKDIIDYLPGEYEDKK